MGVNVEIFIIFAPGYYSDVIWVQITYSGDYKHESPYHFHQSQLVQAMINEFFSIQSAFSSPPCTYLQSMPVDETQTPFLDIMQLESFITE